MKLNIKTERGIPIVFDEETGGRLCFVIGYRSGTLKPKIKQYATSWMEEFFNYFDVCMTMTFVAKMSGRYRAM